MALDSAPTPALPCGRDPLTVIDQARAGRLDAHSLDCEFCQSVIAEDGQLDGWRNLAAEAPPAPATLLPAVMAAVWAELRPGLTLTLAGTDGPAFATEQAVVTLLQRSLEEFDDLMVHRCRLELALPPEEAAELPAETVAGDPEVRPTPPLRIEITAAAAFRSDLAALADRVRRRTVAVLQEQFGLTTEAIDIDFTDLFQIGEPA